MNDNESICSNISWSSQLTTCPSFEKMLNSTWTNVKLQKKMMEVMISLRNTIKNNGGSESPTEFYASLIALMKNVELDGETIEACGYIMKALLSSGVPASVIRHTTSDILKIVTDLLSEKKIQNENVIKFCLLSLGKILKVQTSNDWRMDNVKHIYRILFAYTFDSRSVINEYARKAVVSIFQNKAKKTELISHKSPLHKETLAILSNNIHQTNMIQMKRNIKVKASADDDRLSLSLTTISHLLLSKVLDEESKVTYIETLIQCLLSMQIVPIQCQILSNFAKLFRSKILSTEVLGRCLTSLFAYINICTGSNIVSDISVAPPIFICKTWLNTVLIGFESLLLNKDKVFVQSDTLMKMNGRDIALAHATSLIKFCSDWLLSDDSEIKSASNAVLTKLCSGYLMTTEEKSNYLDPNEYDDVEKWFIKWTEILGRHLNTQHEVLWSEVLENVTHLVLISNGKCPIFISKVLQIVPKMAELRDSYEDSESEIIAALTSTSMKNCRSNLTPIEKKLKANVESLIGQIMKNYGIESVLNVIPLCKIINENDVFKELNNRSWLVPLMKTYVDRSSPEKFRLYILPFIQFLTEKMDVLSVTEASMDTNNNKSADIAVATLGMLRYQLWSCLPSFAKNIVPGGVEEVDISFWNILLNLLSPVEPSNLEIIAMNTMRNIIKTAQDQDEMKRVLTSNIFCPKFLKNLYSQYMKNEKNNQNSIKITLDSYFRIFVANKFSPNCDMLLKKVLTDIDQSKPTEDQLLCMELLIILTPHLSEEKISEVTTFMEKLIECDAAVSSQLQKRVYRYLDIVTSSNTPTSNQYTKDNLQYLLRKLASWNKVQNESWKCRMKCLYNLFKLMNSSKEIADFLNEFLPEIINCLNLKAKKTRAVSGLILVEGIIGCSVMSEDEENTLSQSINGMLEQLIFTLKEKMPDNTKSAIAFKEALAKGLFLILSEPRLAKAVTREHIDSALNIVTEILSNHNSENENRHLVHVALDILKGLLKSKKLNYSRVEMSDLGICLKSASDGLLRKVRTAVKNILRKMLKWWSYEDIKTCLPEELIPVLRNLHKEFNRENRTTTKTDDDNESNATSWMRFSESGSQNTMKNPNIKNIVDILQDSDDECDDLESKFSKGMTLGGKSNMSIGGKSSISKASNKSKTSKATELRKIRKRKIAEANNTLWLEEKDGEVVDISDPVNVAQHLRMTGRDVQPKVKSCDKVVERRGFRVEGGRLLIGNVEENQKPVEIKSNEDTDDEDDLQTKERFETTKKRVRMEKLPGSEYKSHKKGTFGDIKRKDKPDPYAYVELNGNFSSKMKSYINNNRKCLKATRKMSKEVKKNKSNKKN